MNIITLSKMSLNDLQTAYACKEVSPVEIIDISLNQIEETAGQINALYEVRHKAARKEALAAEMRYRTGDNISAFDGIPVTIKDSVNAVGMSWFHGSAIHGKGIVATVDAPPVKRLKQAGTIILGKAKMPDFGLSGSGVSGSHGIIRNPWGLSWNTGGSSAGAGASIAAGIGMMSVGSDIAGSVRLPASHCGLAALKPTQGVIPHTPASTVRSAGPITRKAEDLHPWTQLLSGPDDYDRFSIPYAPLNDVTQIKVGTSHDFGFGPAVEPAVLHCFAKAKQALSEIVGEIFDVTKKANTDLYIPIDDTLKIRGWLEYSDAHPDLKSQVPSQLFEWFKEAENWSLNRTQDINKGIEKGVAFCVDLLSDVDFLLTPVMPIVNFPAENRGIDPKMPLRHTTFTALFNQSGHPAVSICGGFDKRGLPIGVQLVGKRFDDARLLKLASELEAKLNIFGNEHMNWPIAPII